jgi:hypothetical protein
MLNRFLTGIVLLGTCFSGSTWAGTAPTGFQHEFNTSPGQHLESSCFAQNDPKIPSDNLSTDDASKTHKDSNKSKSLTPEKEVPKKTKPMKPFVPSETIPADQGVDLPYDI